MNCKYFLQSCATWVLNNKLVTFLSLLSFCLFVSTLAMAGQRNRLNDKLEQCENKVTNVESTTDNAITSTTDVNDTTTNNPETTTVPVEIETTTANDTTTNNPETTTVTVEIETTTADTTTAPPVNPDDEPNETEVANDETNDEQSNRAAVQKEFSIEENGYLNKESADNEIPKKLVENTNERATDDSEAAVLATREEQEKSAVVDKNEQGPEKQVVKRKKRGIPDTYESELINRILALATAS